MKYAVILTRGDWEDSAPEDERQRRYGEIGEWWANLASQGKIVGGHQLQPPPTAKTVVLANGSSTVVDGPFLSSEAVGGYGIFEMASIDEAVELLRSFPAPSGKLEVRPVLEP